MAEDNTLIGYMDSTESLTGILSDAEEMTGEFNENESGFIGSMAYGIGIRIPVKDVKVDGSSVVTDDIAEIELSSVIPKSTSQLINDSGFITEELDPNVDQLTNEDIEHLLT